MYTGKPPLLPDMNRAKRSQDTTMSSVADPGCLSRIPDPNLFHPGSGSGSKSASTNLSFFNLKNCF
jgi:hypothetical protein